MVKENSYICIQAFMVNDLHLKGNELLVYAIIYGFSQDGESEFTGSLQYLADWCNTSKQTIISVLQSLCEKQLLMKNVEYKNNIRFCTYKTSMVVKILEQDSQNSLMGYSKNFNGGSQNSLTNNINDILDDTITDNINTQKTKKVSKHKNGTYQNVLLSDSELMKLCDELGSEKAKAVIDNFSELKEMKGYKYKSDYLAIRNWGISAYNEKHKPQSQEEIDAITRAFCNRMKVEKEFDIGEIWEHRQDWIDKGQPQGKEYYKWQDEWYHKDGLK